MNSSHETSRLLFLQSMANNGDDELTLNICMADKLQLNGTSILIPCNIIEFCYTFLPSKSRFLIENEACNATV